MRTVVRHTLRSFSHLAPFLPGFACLGVFLVIFLFLHRFLFVSQLVLFLFFFFFLASYYTSVYLLGWYAMDICFAFTFSFWVNCITAFSPF
jgi:hypothetical protein